MVRRILLSFLILITAFAVLADAKPPRRSKKAGTKKNPTILQEIVITPEVVKPYRASATRHWDLLHTTLEILPLFSTKQLQGRALLYLTPYARSQQKIVLDAVNFSDVSIAIRRGDTATVIPFSYDLYELSIDLPRFYDAGDTLLLDITYTNNTYTFKENNITYNDGRGAYFINPHGKNPYKPIQFWTQGQTHSARCWFPTIDATNERCTQDIYVTVPQPYLTLSNGLLLGSTLHGDSVRTDHWRQSLPHTPYLFFLAAGEFIRVEDEPWNDIAIDYYTISGYEEDVQQVFGNTRDMIGFYSDLLDYPFPWEKYSQIVVYDFTAGAMENTTASNFYDRLYATRQDLIDGHHDGIIAHELIHMWFGNLITAESWANLALNESFADYGEYLWYEHHYGREEAAYLLWQSRRRYQAQSAWKDDAIVNFYYDTPMDMFDNIRYEKGGWVLHMLRYYLGDTLFFRGLNKYLHDHAFGSTEMHQLRLAMEAVSGEDLNWFFNQWMYSEGYPQLKTTVHYHAPARELRVDIVQEQTQQNKPVFRFPLALDIYLPGRIQRERVTINQERQSFYFSCSETPVFVNIDADKALLCTKKEDKTLEQWAAQYARAPLFADRMEALEGLVSPRSKQNAKTVNSHLLAATGDPFWAIRKYAIDNIRLSDATASERSFIADLATVDPHPRVRESALVQLGKYKRADYARVFESVITRDSSPLVLSAALMELLLVEPEKAHDMAAAFDSTRNLHLLAALGKVYATTGGEEQLWVMDKSLWLSTYLKREANFRNYFEYLRRQSTETFARGLQVLSDIYHYEESEENIEEAKITIERLAKWVANRLDDKKVKGKERQALEAKRQLLMEIDL